MLAECIVAMGTMSIPLAVVLLTTIDSFPQNVAIALIIFGITSLVAGLIIAVRKEIASNKRERRLDDRENRRRRLDKSHFIILIHTAEKLGVDLNKAAQAMAQRLDEEPDDEL